MLEPAVQYVGHLLSSAPRAGPVIADHPACAAAAESTADCISPAVPAVCSATTSSQLAGFRFSNVPPSTHSPLM
jgi:hypothetical protein